MLLELVRNRNNASSKVISRIFANICEAHPFVSALCTGDRKWNP